MKNCLIRKISQIDQKRDKRNNEKWIEWDQSKDQQPTRNNQKNERENQHPRANNQWVESNESEATRNNKQSKWVNNWK